MAGHLDFSSALFAWLSITVSRSDHSNFVRGGFCFWLHLYVTQLSENGRAAKMEVSTSRARVQAALVWIKVKQPRTKLKIIRRAQCYKSGICVGGLRRRRMAFVELGAKLAGFGLIQGAAATRSRR